MTKERISSIEKTLTESKELGDAERQLLIVWLEETEECLHLEYEGGFCFDHVYVKLSPSNQIVGFTYDIDYNPLRECDECSGDFKLSLFGFDFWHNGVTHANEHAWYEAEWGEGHELEEALNRRIEIPHVEEYLDRVILNESYVRKALGEFRKKLDAVDLFFFKDNRGRVYVYARDENHFCVTQELIPVLDEIRIGRKKLRDAIREDYEVVDRGWRSYDDVVRDLCDQPIALPEVCDIRDRPLDFIRISEDEAVHILMESEMPFEAEV